jgi:hypothetical protein
MLIRLSGKEALKTVIIEMDSLLEYQEEIVRYAMHEMGGVEQLTLRANGSGVKIPFKYVAYILEKNKDTLTKLCIDLQIEDSSIKHFATLILNMTILRHLHLTMNAQLDKSQSLASFKHIFSKDSLVSIYLDSFPLPQDFLSLLGFSTNLHTLVVNIVP